MVVVKGLGELTCRLGVLTGTIQFDSVCLASKLLGLVVCLVLWVSGFCVELDCLGLLGMGRLNKSLLFYFELDFWLLFERILLLVKFWMFIKFCYTWLLKSIVRLNWRTKYYCVLLVTVMPLTYEGTFPEPKILVLIIILQNPKLNNLPIIACRKQYNRFYCSLRFQMIELLYDNRWEPLKHGQKVLFKLFI